jgi:hypothetical protein
MIDRSVQALPKAKPALGRALDASAPPASRWRPHTLTAFLTGAALLSIGLFSMEAGIAAGLFNSANSPISFILNQAQKRGWASGERAPAPSNVALSAQDLPAHKRNRAPGASAALQISSTSQRRSVCVRLCDGYFFPVSPLARASDLGDHEAACSGLCPDAPTELFVEPTGSDRIEDAVSRTGAPYSSLPMAFSNRTSTDKTCTCHRRPGAAFSLADDSTLRKGDSIMTPTGIVVFRGSGRAPHASTDFVALAKASLPKDKREILAAIERAALPGMSEAALPDMSRSISSAAPPRRSQFAFAAPATDRPNAATGANSIRFVEPRIATSN